MTAATDWILLSYRVPREPSTPRIAIWRRLKTLGVATLGDGLVALPIDARTREQLEWVAANVREAGGAASLWIAQPTSARQEATLVRQLTEARAAEYRDLLRAAQAKPANARAVTQLRRELHRINRRDYFPPPERAAAKAAVEALAAAMTSERASR